MATRQDIVTEARAWLGTRWMHQQSLKGQACDCIGLVKGVAIGAGLVPADFATRAEVTQFSGYGRRPDGRLIVALDLFLDRVTAKPEPGDVLLMRFDKTPQHVAIVSDIGIIHAHATARRVVEHRLDEVWSQRIVAVYRFRGVQPCS
jgi:NlpC/P60 family putative phage cell wall peptidase